MESCNFFVVVLNFLILFPISECSGLNFKYLQEEKEGINLQISAMSRIKPLTRSPFISRGKKIYLRVCLV